MLELREVIEVPRTASECFHYLRDFSTCQEWDPGVISAKRLTAGPIDAGTAFKVRCALPVGSIDLDYRVDELLPDEQIRLSGRCRYFTVYDTIRFEAVDEESDTPRTRIEYRAQFEFTRIPESWVSRFESGMQRMGRRAVAGLREALEDDYPAPEQAPISALNDKLLLPGMAFFSRLGYTRGVKDFKPISADVRGKHIVITGASSGIGYAMAEALAFKGARLSLVMRNESKAKQVLEELKAATGSKSIDVLLADLSLLADVDALIKRLKAKRKPVDVLINNAGALFDQQRNTTEGLDESLALLLLSPYRLTLGLKPLLLKSDNPRVVNIVSGGMYSQALDLPKLLAPEQRGFSGSVAYARAKRGLMIATEELASRWAQDGIVINAMHPGWADTPGVEQSLPEFYKLTKKILRTPAEGADTAVWMAAATEAGKMSGKLLLDRVPRDSYLVPGTRENKQAREQLMAMLDSCETASDVSEFLQKVVADAERYAA